MFTNSSLVLDKGGSVYGSWTVNASYTLASAINGTELDVVLPLNSKLTLQNTTGLILRSTDSLHRFILHPFDHLLHAPSQITDFLTTAMKIGGTVQIDLATFATQDLFNLPPGGINSTATLIFNTAGLSPGNYTYAVLSPSTIPFHSSLLTQS